MDKLYIKYFDNVIYGLDNCNYCENQKFNSSMHVQMTG